MLAYTLLATLAALGFFKGKQRTEKELLYIADERDNLQKRLDALIDDQTRTNPKAFLETFEQHLFDAEPERALELAENYAENQTPALVTIALRQVEAAMMNVGEDGPSALEEANRFIAQGLHFQPSSQSLNRLKEEISLLGDQENRPLAESLNLGSDLDLQGLRRVQQSLYDQGRYSAARFVAEKMRNKARLENGITTRTFATATNQLATVENALANYRRAERLYKQAIKIDDATLGPDHPNTIGTKSNLAALQSRR